MRLASAKESSVFCLINQAAELAEEICRIVRSRSGLWMILNAKNRMLAVAHAFDGLIVQINVRHFDIRGKRVRIDCESVVL
jgi:hypothetical protein